MYLIRLYNFSDLRMTIPPLVRMRSIISEKNCLEVGGKDELEYQQLQSDDNSSSNSDLNSQEEIKQRGKARRSTQVHFKKTISDFFLIFLYFLDLCPYSGVFAPNMLRNEYGLSSHFDAPIKGKSLGISYFRGRRILDCQYR